MDRVLNEGQSIAAIDFTSSLSSLCSQMVRLFSTGNLPLQCETGFGQVCRPDFNLTGKDGRVSGHGPLLS